MLKLSKKYKFAEQVVASNHSWDIGQLVARRYLRGSQLACFYCGDLFEEHNMPSLEHLIPKSLGGKTWIENLVLACRNCNASRGSLPITPALFNPLTAGNYEIAVRRLKLLRRRHNSQWLRFYNQSKRGKVVALRRIQRTQGRDVDPGLRRVGVPYSTLSTPELGTRVYPKPAPNLNPQHAQA